MIEIKTQKKDGYDLLVLKGEIDASNSVVLDQAIQKLVLEGSKSILVDGQELDYISSAGLGVFMSYLEDFQEKDIQFRIVSLTPRVLEVFKILGLDQLIQILPDKSSII
jgi:anti-sigma B factor antagonist